MGSDLSAAIRQARAQMIAAGIPPGEAGLDAELLARHVLGCDRAALVARLAEPPPAGFRERYAAVVARRQRREPMAYIVGAQEFWGRDFHVGPGVLIPRPETELLVEEALAWLALQAPATIRILDVGTGSGCLAVTLALDAPGTQVEATDISEAALAVAKGNAERLGAPVRFHHGALLAGAQGPFDLIVSNPPYVARREHAALQSEVRDFEPATALVGGEDGLEIVRALVEDAGAALRLGGRLLMEIGHGQAAAVDQVVRASGQFELVGIRPDLQGIPRTVVAARGIGIDAPL